MVSGGTQLEERFRLNLQELVLRQTPELRPRLGLQLHVVVMPLELRRRLDLQDCM